MKAQYFSCTIACIYVHESVAMIPFITLAQKNMDCHHGVDIQLVAKEKRKKYKSNEKVLSC